MNLPTSADPVLIECFVNIVRLKVMPRQHTELKRETERARERERDDDECVFGLLWTRAVLAETDKPQYSGNLNLEAAIF